MLPELLLFWKSRADPDDYAGLLVAPNMRPRPFGELDYAVSPTVAVGLTCRAEADWTSCLDGVCVFWAEAPNPWRC